MWKPIVLDVECIVCNKTLHKINHNPHQGTRDMGKVPNNRRLRTPNWSLEEKQYLLELIKTRKEIVVTKSNNGPNYSEEKDVAWNEILRELAVKFGSKFHGSSIKKVKTQWQNMKRIAREEIFSNGQMLQKYSRQSLEVCDILDMMKNGVLKVENQNTNEIVMAANVEIKTECIDEEIDQPSCSGMNTNNLSVASDNQQNQNNLSQFDSSTTSISEQNSENIDSDDIDQGNEKRNVSVMTESSNPDNRYNNYNTLQRDIQEFFKYTATEKQLKMDSLKEERQIVRAMRETAELNKIIAEQRLKHVLWIKKQEMAMYSGEPGSGAGKGGGGGGAIREAGGSFGKMEAAREDEYFYKKQKEQIANLKGHLDKEIAFHMDQIKRHEDAIRRHKEQMAAMENK